jgi:serine protease AprX
MVRRLLLLGAFVAALVPAPALAAPAGAPSLDKPRLDSALRERAAAPRGTSRVILRLDPGVSPAALELAVRGLRGTTGLRLVSGTSQVASVPDTALAALAHLPGVQSVSLDRPVQGTLERTAATIGANWVRENLGFDGTGVGIAIIDSGVANWHDDLGATRVTRFVDFVNFQTAAYDDYGHGTHVAGIIAGNGHDSQGRRRGIAPGATLLVEKVLDGAGQGYISNVIAAIDYAIANKEALGIRIINLSVAAGVYESYTTDPLTLAAKRAVEAGMIVVSAAGNLGKSTTGKVQYGGVGAPGNAPWVITVGASSHNGTADRSDDTVAAFSSRGPTAIDFQAKPDLVAPGVGIESIAEAGSTLWNTKPLMRLWGTVPTATEPYLSLSGTSMAAPVVSATIALMLQANPALTPNLVKAVLQFSAESRAGYDPMTQGAGFLNARGAVELAQAVAAGASIGDAALLASAAGPARGGAEWGRRIIWGNYRVGGGRLVASANAWRTDVMWGSTRTPEGTPIAWGSQCADGDAACDLSAFSGTAAWTASCTSATLRSLPPHASCENIVWGTAAARDAIISSATCGSMDCESSAGNIVRGAHAADEPDNIVWRAPAIRPLSRRLFLDPALR